MTGVQTCALPIYALSDFSKSANATFWIEDENGNIVFPSGTTTETETVDREMCIRDSPSPVPGLPCGVKSGTICGKSGGDVWKIRLWKTRLYQGFPGPFWGWAVSFYGLPLFCSNAFHIYPRRFWTLCPEVAGHLRRCYSGRKSRLCDPPHDPV